MQKLSMQILSMQNTHKIIEIPSIVYLRKILQNLNILDIDVPNIHCHSTFHAKSYLGRLK
jgi:hypothetical protein